MSGNRYSGGDMVTLKAGLKHAVSEDRICKIIALLPAADHGEPQYRVRMGSENFERRIVESDIDQEASSHGGIAEVSTASAGVDQKPWFKPLSTKLSK
jgi:hypothetical protein